jgi:hypothetical protein
MTMLSYGNMQFAGTSQTETPQPINKKVCTIDNVSKVADVPNNG